MGGGPSRRGRRRLWIPIIATGAALLGALLLVYARPVPDWDRIEEAMRAGRTDRAVELLRRRVSADPSDERAWLTLGAVLADRGEEALALEALARVDSVGPAWAQARAAVGELALRRGDVAEAEAALRQAVAADPGAVEPRRRLVFLLTVQQRREEARALLWELYRLERDVRHVLMLAGLGAVDSDDRELGPVLDRFLESSPEDPWLRRARGLMDLRLGRPAEALPLLESVAEAFDDDPEGRLALAESLLLTGAAERVEEALGPEPSRPGDRARYRVLLGRLAESRGDPSGALRSYEAAVAADPGDRVALFRLGQALIGAGKAREGRSYLDRAEAVRALENDLRNALNRSMMGLDDAEEYERIGRLCLELGMRAEARAFFEESVRRDLGRSGARLALAALEEPAIEAPVAPRLRAEAASERGAPGGPARPSSPPRAAAEAGPGATIRFEDVAERSGVRFRYESGGTPEMFIADTMGGGVALFDYDGDGRLDIYFVNGCALPFDAANPPAPNVLYRNNGDGTFTDVTEAAGVGGLGYGMGVAVGDFDGDGHEDLLVTGLDRTILYRNLGDGTFTDVTEAAGVTSDRWTTAAGFADLDGDGDLDLFVVTYVEARPGEGPVCRDHHGKTIHCPPDYFPAQFDLLFRNNGDGTFTDVSAEAGIEVPDGPGLGLAIADLDGDGLLDLFVANDTKPDHVFRNLGGLRFEEVGRMFGLAYDGEGIATASMGVLAADFDGDGLIDVFHTNFLNEANTLLRNLGGGQFLDATTEAGLNAPSRGVTGWGVALFDADNDGIDDLFYTNGHIDDQPWAGRPMAQRQHLLVGIGGGRYRPAPESAGPYFSERRVGRGVAAGDLDRDGRIDLVVVHRDAPAAVLSNRSRSGHWVAFRLVGTESASAPVGARVTCHAGGRSATRWVTAGDSYLSAHDRRIHFGLGPSDRVDRLEVAWPSGRSQSWSGLPADRFYELREGGEPIPEDDRRRRDRPDLGGPPPAVGGRAGRPSIGPGGPGPGPAAGVGSSGTDD